MPNNNHTIRLIEDKATAAIAAATHQNSYSSAAAKLEAAEVHLAALTQYGNQAEHSIQMVQRMLDEERERVYRKFQCTNCGTVSPR